MNAPSSARLQSLLEAVDDEDMRVALMYFIDKMDGMDGGERDAAAVELRRLLRQGAQREARRAAALARLTPRERRVAALLERGPSNAELARGLGVSERTARVHLEAMMRKLGVSNRTALLAAVLGL